MVRTGSPIVSSDTEILVATARLEGMKSELMEEVGSLLHTREGRSHRESGRN